MLREEENMIINNKAVRECDRRKLEPGDKIVCQGIETIIAEIKYQEYWEDSGFIAEFIDTNGIYRNWKQQFDGGYVIAIMKISPKPYRLFADTDKMRYKKS